MLFETVKEKLIHAIAMAERLVGKKESLPVLSCILFTIKDGGLTIQATNLEAGITVTVPGEKREDGVLAVPASIVSQTVRSVSGGTVSLKEDGGNLLVESHRSRTLIKTIAHNEFPQLSGTDSSAKGFTIARDVFLTTLQSVSYAASPSMIRPELGSVLVSFKDGKLVCVATDSFRLAEKTAPKVGDVEDRDILIPLKHALELMHILERMNDEKIELVVDDSQLVMRGEGVQFISRVVDATFPNYKEIIPKKFTTEATLLKGEFAEMLRKARVFSGSEQCVGIHVYPKKKVFDATAQSASIGEMSDSLDAALSGDDIDINFHIGYLADCLPMIASDSIVLGFSGHGKPLVIRGISDQSFTYLVMPLNR